MTRRGFFKKRSAKGRSIQTEYRGILFDSQTEANYYKHLEQDETVFSIELQPEYKIIEPYKVICGRCKGLGTILNGKTGNLNKCRLCAGEGAKTKPGAKYTADFKVWYKDGSYEVIDIKGGPVERDFPLRKKLLESKSGHEVVVIRFKNKEWVRS